MRTVKILFAVAALVSVVAFAAHASETWSRAPLAPARYQQAPLGTSTRPDETSAPTAITDGFDLESTQLAVLGTSLGTTKPYLVTVTGIANADGGGYLGDGGCVLGSFDGGCMYPRNGISESDPDAAYEKLIVPPTRFRSGRLEAWILNPISLTWARSIEWDLYVQSGLITETFSVSGLPGAGRIAYQPVGFGMPVRVYVASY